jgi:amino acid permease
MNEKRTLFHKLRIVSLYIRILFCFYIFAYIIVSIHEVVDIIWDVISTLIIETTEFLPSFTKKRWKKD